MPASLPPRPRLEWLRKTAKDRLAELRATEPASKLADAQRAVARDYGFTNWRALKAHVERATAPPQPPSSDAVVAAFLQRVGTGRIDDVRAMLQAAPPLVNAAGPHPFWGGRPQPLHVAIEGKRRDIVDLLLAHGADVNGTNDSYGHWSPLMLAINRKAPELRDELLRRGARVGLVEALMLADDHCVDVWPISPRATNSTTERRLAGRGRRSTSRTTRGVPMSWRIWRRRGRPERRRVGPPSGAAPVTPG